MDGEAPERGQSDVLLSSEIATSGFAQRRYPVVPLLAKGALTYWLALAITLLRDYDLFVTSASFLVFEGSPRDQDKTPLFRAEWHEWDSVSIHAQPHWHVYRSALSSLADQLPEAFVTEAEQIHDFIGANPTAQLASKDLAPTLAEFHYAMSANWHLSGSYQQSLSTEASLTAWLGGCVSYCRGQLEYLTR